MSQADGRSVKTRTTFRMECAVAIRIDAPADRVWSLLTDAAGFPKWNSTVTSIEGPIELGRKLAIKVPAAPSQTFKPKVTVFEPTTKMVWSDGMMPMFQGTRTFELRQDGSATVFSMNEVFRGMMLPMIAGSLPDFGPIFETYAADLKRAAEKG